MPSSKFLFGKKGLAIRAIGKNKTASYSCGWLIIIFVSSLVFGFLGGALSVYSLVNRDSLKNSNMTLESLGKKTYKVTENSAVIEAVKKINPSVVSITAVSNIQDIFGTTRKQQSAGSGFVITSDGLILTNKHVASDTNADYTVLTSDGQGYKAKVKAKDPFNDLAILKIEAKDLTPVTLGNSDDLEVGQKVIAIGNALGFQNTVTSGVISAKERTIEAGDTSGSMQEKLEGLLQTDAAINAGNSGGPLINLDGQVVGIDTAVADKGVAEGIGFAIPINLAKSAIESYKKYNRIVRPFLGVRYVSLSKEIASQNGLDVDKGAWIKSGDATQPGVVSGSPAANAGLKEGDIITAINGEQIDDSHSLSYLLQKYHPNDTIEITYLADGKDEKKIEIKLGEYKS